MKIFREHRTFDEVAIPFLEEKEIELSYKTFIGYRTKVNALSIWLTKKRINHLPIHKITSQMMSEFFIYLSREKDLDKPTVEKYFVHLRKMWRFAKKRSWVDSEPFDLIVFPQKKRDCGAEVIPIDKLRVLLTEIQKKDPQLFLACMIQYYCFIRPGRELRSMKVGDIDFDRGVIRISYLTAKSKRDDSITMPQQLIDICQEQGLDKIDKTLFIFGHKRIPGQKSVSENMLRYRFNKYRDMFNLGIGIKLYSFKHTGATMLHQCGTASMRDIMDHLRHTRLEATQHYIKKHGGVINERIRVGFPSPI